MMNFNSYLIEKIKSKKIVLLGELHGTKEIPELITTFFNNYLKENNCNICLEIPSDEQKSIDEFLKTGDEKYIYDMDFFKHQTNLDGRNSKEYFDLITNIYNLNKNKKNKTNLFCIDVSIIDYTKDIQQQREIGIAKNIIKIMNNNKTFVILGNMHIVKQKVTIGPISFLPVGYYLFEKYGNRVVSINLWPKEGKFFNFSVKEVPSDNLPDNYFDYTFFIDKVTPCSFLN